MAILIGGTPATNLDLATHFGSISNGDILVLQEPGDHTFTGNLDQSAKTIGGFITYPGVNLIQRSPITFGGITSTSTSTLALHGSGVLYLISAVSIAAMLNPAMKLWGLDGAWTYLHVEAGEFNGNDDCEFNHVSTGPGARGVIESHASDIIDDLDMGGGSMVVRRDCVGRVAAGKLRYEDTATFEDGSNTGELIVNGPRAEVEMAGSATTGDKLRHIAGGFDMTDHGADFVIDERRLGPAARAITEYAAGSLTVTSEIPLGPNQPSRSFPLGSS